MMLLPVHVLGVRHADDVGVGDRGLEGAFQLGQGRLAGGLRRLAEPPGPDTVERGEPFLRTQDALRVHAAKGCEVRQRDIQPQQRERGTVGDRRGKRRQRPIGVDPARRSLQGDQVAQAVRRIGLDRQPGHGEMLVGWIGRGCGGRQPVEQRPQRAQLGIGAGDGQGGAVVPGHVALVAEPVRHRTQHRRHRGEIAGVAQQAAEDGAGLRIVGVVAHQASEGRDHPVAIAELVRQAKAQPVRRADIGPGGDRLLAGLERRADIASLGETGDLGDPRLRRGRHRAVVHDDDPAPVRRSRSCSRIASRSTL